VRLTQRGFVLALVSAGEVEGVLCTSVARLSFEQTKTLVDSRMASTVSFMKAQFDLGDVVDDEHLYDRSICRSSAAVATT
jgi:hypothetical protein